MLPTCQIDTLVFLCSNSVCTGCFFSNSSVIETKAVVKIAQQTYHKTLVICTKRRNFEFSANFFRKYPDFCEKNVRCIVREGYVTMIIEILQLWGCHRLSKKFFKQIPAFWQKNVRCTVERVHDTVNKILHSWRCPFARKKSV